jgi:hypothetical protein
MSVATALKGRTNTRRINNGITPWRVTDAGDGDLCSSGSRDKLILRIYKN